MRKSQFKHFYHETLVTYTHSKHICSISTALVSNEFFVPWQHILLVSILSDSDLVTMAAMLDAELFLLPQYVPYRQCTH